MIFERPCRLLATLGLLIAFPGALAAQVGTDLAIEAGLSHVRALGGTGTGVELSTMFGILSPVLGTTPSVGLRARVANISPAGWPRQGGKGRLIDIGVHLRMERKVFGDRLSLNASVAMEWVDAYLTIFDAICLRPLDRPTCLPTASKALGVGAGGGAQYQVAPGFALSLGMSTMWSDLEMTAEHMLWIYSFGVAFRP